MIYYGMCFYFCALLIYCVRVSFAAWWRQSANFDVDVEIIIITALFSNKVVL